MFSDDGFIPRRFCGDWPTWLVSEHVAGNFLVWTAYVAVPVLMLRLVRRKLAGSPFRGVVFAFALFIGLCGLGHLLDMLAFFYPLYRLSGHVLLATGLVSWWTVWSLRLAVPKFFAMKGPAELERVIAERTAELTEAVAELKRSEAAKEYLAKIVESSHDAIMGRDLDGTVTSWNSGAEQTFGYTAEEAVGQPITFLMTPHTLAEEAAILERVRRGEFIDHLETVRRTKDGRLINAFLTVSPIKDRSGRIIGISKTIRDVTARRKAEADLRDSEARLRAIVDGTVDGIITIDERGTIETVNPATLHAFGYAPEELIGRNVSMLMPESYGAGHDGDLGNYRETGEKRVIGIGREVVGRRKDGSTFPIDLSVSEVRLEGRRIFTGIVRDITARKQAEAERRDGEGRFRQLAESIPQLAWMAQPDGDIFWYNQRWYEYTGKTPGEMEGWGWQSVHDPEVLSRVLDRWRASIKKGEPFEMVFPLRGADGLFKQFLTRGYPSHDAQGRVLRWFGTNTDIDEQKRAEEAAREATEMAVAQTQAKADFLAAMSHEIRTPMNGVIGAAGLLLTTTLTAEQNELLKTIRDSGNSLLVLINDILDVSRIDAGQLSIEAFPFSVRHVAEEAAGLVAPVAFAKGLETVTDIAPGLHGWYKGDAGRISQILVNLLGNAAKFTPRGGEIVLSASAEPAGDGIALVRLSVKDTGIGVHPSRLDAIFERFTQADTGTARGYGGTGLGLTICRSLAELMGGKIGVESQLGRGSMFWLELPLPILPEEVTRRPRGPQASGGRVLIADGCSTVRTVLREHLHEFGLDVVESATAADAGEVLRSAGPDAPFAGAFLDERLPSGGAHELAETLGRDPATASVPLVLLRSGAREGAAAWNRSGRFKSVLSKPVRTSTLYDTLIKLLSGGAAADDRPAEAPAPCARFDGTRVLLVEDNPTNQKIGLMMLDRLGCVADAVGDGYAAVDVLSRVSYDLALMDVQMPGMDGFEVVREIRRREASGGGHVLIVAMTANALRGDRERCLDAGMDDYLSKPVTLERLSDLLRKWRPAAAVSDPTPPVEDESGGAPVSPPAVANAETRDAPVSFSPGRLAQFSDGDASLEAALIGSFLKDGGKLMGKLKAAFEGGEAAILLQSAHALYGMCGMLGVTALAETAKQVERLARADDSTGVGHSLDLAYRRFAEARAALEAHLARVELTTAVDGIDAAAR